MNELHNNTLTRYDETAPFEHFQHNGYYQVGDKIFNFRFNALEYATKTKQDVNWEFNTAGFRSVNWRTPLNVDIRTLYKQRAQQLRDKYDYLILSFSGGADSTTILQSFIYNNIHLDEIICDWPLAHTNNITVSRDTTPTNHTSEWELAIKPMLEYVKKHHPTIKITITDTTKDLTVEDDDYTFTISHMGPYQSTKRYKNIAARYNEVNEKNDCVAIIMGTEKPALSIDRNVLGVYFSDQHCFFKSSYVPNNRVVEYFYWATEMPELVREQAHLIYQHLLANPELQNLFKPETKLSNDLSRHKSNLLKSIIYPDWSNAIFQADKSESLIWSSQHAWILKEKTRALDGWQSTLTSRLGTIDPKYFNFLENSKYPQDFKPFYSRLYPIGILPPTIK